MLIDVQSDLGIAVVRAGWWQGRRIDVAPIADKLRARGFDVFEPARVFVEEFGYLELSDPHGRRNRQLSLDPLGRHPWDPDDAAQRVGSKVCPIGFCDFDQTVLLMTDQGHVFSEGEDTLVHMGISGVDALARWAEDRPYPPPVPRVVNERGVPQY